MTTENEQVATKATETPAGENQVENEQVADKTFTQAELDYTIRKRLSRQAEQYADYDALKDKAAQLDAIEEANKTELEKVQSQLEKAQADAVKAGALANEQLLRSTVTASAAVLGFADPADAYALISGATTDNADDLLKELAEKKPYLLGKTKPPKIGATNPAGGERITETDAERRYRLGI